MKFCLYLESVCRLIVGQDSVGDYILTRDIKRAKIFRSLDAARDYGDDVRKLSGETPTIFQIMN